MSKSKTINISLPEELLDKVDKVANSEFANRSDFIRDSLVRRLNTRTVLDEWGDEGEWETVVNFRDIVPGGVLLDDVLAAINTLLK
jgi:metal-responsive CopG/Arc/MetJ family transcriptional regulator